MVVYTAALKAAENNEPMTRIMRDVMWANMALDRSGIDAEYNVVGNKEVTYTEQNFDTILKAMMDETAPFVGIDAERAAAGADLLMLYMKLDGAGSGGSTCGRATVPGVRREGDMFSIERDAVVSAVGVGTGCQTGTLAHELGHNLGLGHSARQTDSVGTWIWSRGHGVADGFVTVMGYASSFNVTADKIEQIYSTPDVSTCGASDDLPCGLARTDANGADATRSIKATMYQIAALADAVAPADPDTDGDGEVNSVDLDDDDDGLTDVEEAALGTNPLLADTDGDTVNDNIDAFPLDATETVDTDRDMVGANADANDNDASVTWTRTNVTLPVDATVATNLIATFDDTTEDPAAIRAGGCPASARYQVTFTSRWNASSHGNSPPYPAGSSPHFTPLVGSTHNSQVTFWQRGQLATRGIESIAELGSTGTFRNMDQANARAAGNAGAYINIGGLGAYPSSATRQIDVSEDFPLLTLASMIAPTPDWFVGVSGFNLKEGSRGCWKRTITENLVGNDAGTEKGTGYSLGNPAETTHKPIGPITALPQAVRNNPFATLSLVLQAGDGSSGSGAGKYQVTGVFADASLASWNDFDSAGDAARVGDASVSTWQIGTTTNAAATGTIKINGVTLAGDYLNFLMAGGNGSVDVGVQVLAAGTTTMLAEFKPNACTDRYLKGDSHWRHIDVSALAGQSVDILIFDNDSASNCGFVAFDHFYQSDSLQGTLADTASPDTDGDGVIDRLDAFPNDRNETADTDGDGVGDNADAFPNDRTETADTDGDGVGDNADAFPNDRTETADSDGDGVGDNADAFPNDRTETVDTDMDGTGNNTDPDDDGDGVVDEKDFEPLDEEVAFDDRSFGVNLVLKADAVNAANVIASFEYPVDMQSDDRFILTGLFADPDLAADGWNIFEIEIEDGGN